MDKSVNTAKIDEYAVRSDIFNNTFKYLSFFEFGNDL